MHAMLKASDITLEQVEAFQGRYRKLENGCWQWTGSTQKNGYGRVRVGAPSITTYAHRVAWILEHGGPISEDRPYILHRCGNKSCVCPDHLYAGTKADAMREMVKTRKHARGANVHTAKMNDDKVRALRKRHKAYVLKYGWKSATGRPTAKVRQRFYQREAKRYGVAVSTIARIINRTQWKGRK